MDDQNLNHFKQLKQKIEERNKKLKQSIVGKHREAFDWAINNTKQIAAGAMGGLMLLSSPNMQLLASSTNEGSKQQFLEIEPSVFMVTDIKQYLPDEVGVLIPGQEEKIGEILSSYYGFSVKSQIDGFRLLHTYGYIGAEQHLMRFSGDTMEGHFDNTEDEAKYYSSGLAPGRGGFGYFASSRGEMTQKEIDREKYYIAVQTFLAPGIDSRRREYINFFKFRKMLVVSPNTGRAVVAVIGDAGPAVWTKKHLGGSPEVMKHLQRVDGKQKGSVLYFFIEDPEDKIPLGPIEPIDTKSLVRS